MNAAHIDLSVIVVIHNSGDLALDTLRSARGVCDGLRTQWLVVDSGSTDDTAERIAREWSDVTIIRGDNAGFAAGNNRGLQRARGRYVLLLNPDVEIAGGTISQLVGALDERPDVGAASVVQRGTDGRLLHSIRRDPGPTRQLGEALFAARWPWATQLQEQERRADQYAIERSADWVVGAFLLVRSEAIACVGGLDERFFLYSEEADWCLRMRRAGWDVRHLPTVTVKHHQGGYQRPELAAQLTYSKILFADKHLSRAAGVGMRAALAVGHVARIVLLIGRGSRGRARVRREWCALSVTIGATSPPYPQHRDGHAPV